VAAAVKGGRRGGQGEDEAKEGERLFVLIDFEYKLRGGSVHRSGRKFGQPLGSD
jgi:hypothetical protein